MRAWIVLSSIVVLLSGCATIDHAQPGDPEYSATNPTSLSRMDVRQKKQSSGSIYSEASSVALFETNSAKRVGDIITVVLNEQTQGISNARTQTSKETTSEITSPTILGKSFKTPKNVPFMIDGPTGGVVLSSENEFEGESMANQNNQLIGTISVTVSEVLSNGNLVIKGEKWINITAGKEFIRLKGIVRPADISAQNTISSLKIADAQITYSGAGQSQNNHIMGWMTKFFTSALWLL